MSKKVDRTIHSLRGYLRKADNVFYEDLYGRSGFEYPDMVIQHYVKKTFIEMLILMESLGLVQTYAIVSELYKEAKESKEGFGATGMGQDEPYLIWPGRLSNYIDAIANIHNVEGDETFKTSFLIDILRHAVYPITDSNLFSGPPTNERELHIRIEAILRCVYPDLIHQPSLAKPIKNFRPDSGIPSLSTLLEYKYISSQADSKRVADEVLADRAAYRSRDWKTFLFVIYETKRIRHEKEWKQLFLDSAVSTNTEVIVLSGVPKARKRIKKSDKN